MINTDKHGLKEYEYRKNELLIYTDRSEILVHTSSDRRTGR